MDENRGEGRRCVVCECSIHEPDDMPPPPFFSEIVSCHRACMQSSECKCAKLASTCDAFLHV